MVATGVVAIPRPPLGSPVFENEAGETSNTHEIPLRKNEKGPRATMVASEGVPTIASESSRPGEHVEFFGALCEALATNTSISTLRLRYNPAIDDAVRDELRKAAEQRASPLKLEL